MEQKTYVLDTSVIIEKAASKMIKDKKLKGKIIVTRASLAELEHQANQGQEIGFLGLEEIQELQKLSKQEKIELVFAGTRPTISQIKYAKIGGEIDAVIRDIAYAENAVLITADRIQSESAKALGMEVIFLEFKELKEKLEFEKYFDPDTMSVHLREDTKGRAKRGKPGQWSLVDIGTEILTTLQVQKMAKEIVERARTEQKAFIEISRPGSTVVQFHTYRIVITKPPVSDAWEITAVRPIKQLNVEDYNLPEKISDRIKTKARGVVVAGETGSGKCLPKGTKVYLKNNIIKNIEDIQVDDQVLTYDKSCKITNSKVINTFNRRVGNTLKIITNFGKEIELTPEHSVLSFKEGIPQWIQANELGINSRIATVRKLDSQGILQKIEWVKLLGEENILVKLNKKLNIKIQIEEGLLGLKNKIVSCVKKNKKCKLKELHVGLGSKSGWISVLLLELVKENIIKRQGKSKNYVYSLNKNNINIKKGEIIPLKTLRKYLSDDEIYDITAEISKFDTWHRSAFIKPTRYITKELCELLGYYLGESLTKYGISTDSKYCRDRFKELSKNIFNINLDKERGEYDIYTDKYGTIELFLNKCLGISLFKSKKRATHHKFPEQILNSPKIELSSFLRAYFDTEGYIHKEKGIEISSASRNLIDGTQLALLNFNIQSTIRVKFINNKPYYILYIYGYENVKKFSEEINLVEKLWQLERYLQNNKAGSPNKDTIPVGPLIDRINKREGLGIKYPFLKRDFSHYQANKMISILDTQIKQDISLIEVAMLELASSDYLQWDKVTNIIGIYNDKEVYDIEVENTHNFLAGNVPFIVHNSTFAQSLAEFYASQERIVKTVESPRDLILSDKITQYSKNLASSEEIHDILFLSRPDYIIFDEMRDTPDFKLYVDLRLGGSNVLGVLHAATPIDAIQRFIGRIDVGMIPSVLDTIIYIDKGAVGKILTVSMTVKVPAGMTEADLARPIVIVSDFLTNKVEFEIYSYGEQTVVVPTSKVSSSDPTKELAAKHIEREIKKYASNVKAKILSPNRVEIQIPKDEIANIIGREGKNIEKLEKELGIGIDVRELASNAEREERLQEETIQYSISESGKNIEFLVDHSHSGKQASIFINDQFLIESTISKKGTININKKSKIGQTLSNSIRSHKKVEIKV